MSENTINGKVAIVGIAETAYYKRGAADRSEFQLTVEAILDAAADAGIDVRDIDGFASYSMDRNDPPRIAAALGSPDLSFSNMFWGGGGGGGSGRSQTGARRWWPGIRSTWWCTGAWPRDSSAGSGRGPRPRVSRAARRSPSRTG